MVSQLSKAISKVHDRITLFIYLLPFVKKNVERKITAENTLCLFCQPREGSTRLAEILLKIPKGILIDEPLWRGTIKAPLTKPDYCSRKISQIANLIFFYNQYIPPESEWPEAKDAFTSILAGKAVSIGLYEEQGLKNLKPGGLYIAKFNYANMLMPWLVRQFDFNAILFTRHPFAVVVSQLKFPAWRDLVIPEKVLIEDFPYNEYYHEAVDEVVGIGSREKYWALDLKIRPCIR